MSRVGIIGSGFIAGQHLRSWTTIGVPVHLHGGTGVADLAAGTTASVHTDLASLLDAVDVVDICTPTDTHRDLVVTAARSGCDVICEKPLALHTAEAEEMVEVCRVEGRQLHVAHVLRYFPEYAALRQRIVDGAVGQPAVIRLARESFAPNRPATHWMFDQARSGGIICDLMIHDIDYARWLAGPVARVFARTARVAATEFDDHAFAVLTHTSGALTHLTASWAFPPPTFRTRVEIAGSTGLLSTTVDQARGLELRLRTPSSDRRGAVGFPDADTVAGGDDPITSQLRDFLAAIEGASVPRVSVDDAVEAVRIAAAARESSLTGQVREIGGADD
jgi:predicted dehydrogenase